MQEWVVETTLTRDDWRAYQTQASESSRGHSVRVRWVIAVVVLVAGIAVSAFGINVPALIFGASIYAVLALTGAYARHQHVPDEPGIVLGPRRIAFDDQGYRVSTADSESTIHWPAVRAVTATATHLYLWIDRLAAQIVPVRDLPDGLTADAAVQWIRDRITGGPAANVAGAASDGSALAREPAPRVASDPVDEQCRAPSVLRTFIRLLTWQSLDPATPRSPEAWIAGFSMLSFGLWVGLDRLRAGEGATWFGFGLFAIAWLILGIVAASWIAARGARPPQRQALVLLRLSAFMPLVVAFAAAFDRIEMPWFDSTDLIVVLGAIGLGYLGWQLRRVGSQLSVPASLGLLMLLAGTVWSQSTLYWSTAMWSDAEDSAETNAAIAHWQDTERLLFSQPERIDRQLAALPSAATDQPRLFFVGFAGVAEQRVFSEEVKLAARVVGQRYPSMQPPVLLLNDQREVEAQPLATVSGLRRALKGVASHMNPERDVLFLFLSSHGSDNPEISVSNGMLPLASLSGQALGDALRESGIRWRVIVISACHAGAFINSLKDDHTMVLAAAAADRSSFGCSDDRQITHFGEALFRDALPRAASLPEAFKEAQRALAAREREAKVEASHPTAFYGEAIQEHWRYIERDARAVSGDS